MQIPVISRKRLQSRICNYLDREQFKTRSSDEIKEIITTYLGASAFEKIKGAIITYGQGEMSPPEFYNHMAQRVDTSSVAELFSGRSRKGIEWDMMKIAQEIREGHKTLLDLGCGQGLITCFIAAENPKLEITGIDYSPLSIERAIERARKYGLQNTSFKVDNLENTMRDENQYGIILCCHSIAEDNEHPNFINRRIGMLEQCIAPGGKLIVVTNEDVLTTEREGEPRKTKKRLVPKGQYTHQELIFREIKALNKEVIHIWRK